MKQDIDLLIIFLLNMITIDIILEKRFKGSDLTIRKTIRFQRIKINSFIDLGYSRTFFRIYSRQSFSILFRLYHLP